MCTLFVGQIHIHLNNFLSACNTYTALAHGLYKNTKIGKRSQVFNCHITAPTCKSHKNVMDFLPEESQCVHLWCCRLHKAPPQHHFRACSEESTMPSSDQAGFPRALVNLVRAAVKRQEWCQRGTTEQSPHISRRLRTQNFKHKRGKAAASKAVTGACCKKKLEKRSELIHK